MTHHKEDFVSGRQFWEETRKYIISQLKTLLEKDKEHGTAKEN